MQVMREIDIEEEIEEKPKSKVTVAIILLLASLFIIPPLLEVFDFLSK